MAGRRHMTDEEKLEDSLRKIQDARPQTDKRKHRARGDRKYRITRKPDGTYSAGGWRGSDNSLAALAMHRGRTQIGAEGNTCSKPGCGQIPVRGHDRCRHHGGQAILNARRKADPFYKPKRLNVMKRQLRKLLDEGVADMELRRNPTFAACLDVALGSKPPARDLSGAERQAQVRHWENCMRLSLEFIQAWVALQGGDAQPWLGAMKNAHALGLVEGM